MTRFFLLLFVPLMAIDPVVLPAQTTGELQMIFAGDRGRTGVFRMTLVDPELQVQTRLVDSQGRVMRAPSCAPTWSSANPEVLAVLRSSIYGGFVKPRGEGITELTVTYPCAASLSRSVPVVVGAAAIDKPFAATGVEASYYPATLQVTPPGSLYISGGRVYLRPIDKGAQFVASVFNGRSGLITPAEFPMEWSVANPGVLAIVKKYDHVVFLDPVSTGTTTVTFTIEGLSQSFDVTVQNAKPASSEALSTLATRNVTVAPVRSVQSLAGAPATTLPIAIRPAPGSAPAPNLPIAIRPAPGSAPAPNLPIAIMPTPAPVATSTGAGTTVTRVGTSPVTSPAPVTTPVTADRAGAAAPTTSSPANGDFAGAEPTYAAPTGVRAEPMEYRGTALVQWNLMPGATRYDIVQQGTSGTFAGANPFGRSDGFDGSKTAGHTIELPPGTHKLSVVAQYEDGGRSLPAVPVDVLIPRWSGRYRINVLGFEVNRETLDTPLELDGKRDEVYIRAAAQHIIADGSFAGLTQAQTLVHGDVNAPQWSSPTDANRRIKAGSASALGGLRSGDAFPSSTPWIGTCSAGKGDSFPLALWEGELMQGWNAVNVTAQVWETDKGPLAPAKSFAAFSPEAEAVQGIAKAAQRFESMKILERMALKAQSAIEAGVLAPMAGIASLEARSAGLVYMKTTQLLPKFIVADVSKAVSSLDSLGNSFGNGLDRLGLFDQITALAQPLNVSIAKVSSLGSTLLLALNNADRPIGAKKNVNGVLVSNPKLLTISFELLEFARATGLSQSGRGPGIFAMRYDDTESTMGGGGAYTVYVEACRIQ